MKNTKPMRYGLDSLFAKSARIPPTTSPAPVSVRAPPIARAPTNRKAIGQLIDPIASFSVRTPNAIIARAPVMQMTQIGTFSCGWKIRASVVRMKIM